MFLRGVPFSLITSGWLLLLLTTSCRYIVAKRSIPDLWIFIPNSQWHESKPVKYDFSWSAQSPYKVIIAKISWRDSHKHNLLCLHECLVNGWGKIWCATLSISYIGINNIVIIIKQRIGGNMHVATDYTLESSENFNLIFL